MATNSSLPSRGARRRTVLVLAPLAGALASVVLLGTCSEVSYASPTVLASFPGQSYELGGRSLASPGGYGWPVKPFNRQHPVRGFFGDPRIGGAHGTSKQFHFGVDVSAPNGTPVFATISGTVSFIHPDALSVSAGDGLAFEYWHIVPTVRAGQRVKAYETAIGHVEKPWAHVHFSERRNGTYVNPLRAGAMRPFVDDADPRVRAIHLRDGELTADVEDETPIAVPAPWSSLPVMPAVVRWRIAGKRWQTVVDFRTSIPSASAFHAIYAHATRQNHANLPGLYRIRLASGSAVSGLRGRDVQVEVLDAGGNRASGARSLR